jgi:diguanylate cyclase
MTRRIERALPRSADLTAAGARIVTGASVLLAALLTVTAANALFGIGGHVAVAPIRNWLSSAIYVLVAAIIAVRAIRLEENRLGWTLLTVGVSLYGLGNLLWSLWIGALGHPPIPSVCDVLWLSFYPLAAAGVLSLTGFRGRRRPPAGVWLDGVVAGAGMAAIGAAIVFPPVLAGASGGTLAVGTELAYPIGDLLLAGLVVGVVALRGWQIERSWLMLGGGFLSLTVADGMYATQVAAGASTPSAVTNLVYVAGVALLAGAAWQRRPGRTEPRFASALVLLIPAGFMFAALGLLLYDHFHKLDALSFGLATLTLGAAMARMGLAFRDVRGLSEARRLAATDDLTSLPNRRVFRQCVEAAITRAQPTGESLAVLVLDLDNFKQLNDTLGHQAGDRLLRLIGPRLEAALPDTVTLARLGGDEFAMLLHPAPGRERVATVAATILTALNAPFKVHGLALRVTASLGVGLFPADADDVDELMRHADIAMYQAKTGRGRYEFYDHERNHHSRERLALAAELASALEGRGVEVHFQAQADVRSGRIVGVEALVRWRRGDGQLVPPGDFIGAAEHAGLSRALTSRVMDISLAQLRAWRDDGHEVHVAVNTTVADLRDGAFPDDVAAALQHHGLPADALILEVTETSVLADPKRIVKTLERLRDLGIELSLDDFGTGYSSLTHLKSLPVTEIKIDRSFVSRMCAHPTDAAIVYAMIQLGHKLGIRVVAEGVEERGTWDELRALDCDRIQGYLIGRPVPAADLALALASQRHQPPGAGGAPVAPRALTVEVAG